MKRLINAIAVVTLFTAGCGVFAQSERAASERPVVSLVDGAIRVEPDPLRFDRDKRNVVINWRLPADAKVRFAENGIVIDGEVEGPNAREMKRGAAVKAQNEVIECRRTANGLQFTCLNRNSRPGVFKYTIRLVNEQGAPLPPFDPHIFNE
jgi:hypothetical protein